MHFILLGNEMVLPVHRDSVFDIDKCLTAITDDDITSFPSDDNISFIPSPSSSPDLPDVDVLLEFHKWMRAIRDGSPLSLPKSSIPSSPAGDISVEEDLFWGCVHLYDKAGEGPTVFEIPSMDGFFSLLNSTEFVKRSRIITHPLKIYDPMVGDFVNLPPFAYWRQYSWDYYLIVRERGIHNKDCPGLDVLINDLEDPVDIMSKDLICVQIWRQNRANTPPLTQIPSTVPASTQYPMHEEQATQTISDHKRKRTIIEDDVSGPPAKASKTFQRGSGTFNDPIIVLNN